MNPIILYRASRECMDEAELAAARTYFPCTPMRTMVPENSLVIGRYSCLPFYKELDNDLWVLYSKLINSYSQHRYIADLQNWAMDLGDLTPETWTRLEDIPDDGPFVLKGETNSRKHDWNELMFAKDKRAALEVHQRLSKDGLIGYQAIYIRRYVPLKTYMIGIKDLPITDEYRFFVAFGQVLSGGYYWSSHVDDLDVKPDPNSVPKEFLQEVINRVGAKANFYTIDVGQTVDKKWIVLELNDGQMAGLSENDPSELYSNLRKAVDSK